MRLNVLPLAALALALASAQLRAQPLCQGPSDVGFTRYGNTCDFFGQPATLKGDYDRSTCTMTLQMTVASTCCNTYPQSQILLLGAQPIIPGQRLPILVPSCTLSVIPLVALPQPAGPSGAEWSFRLPTVSLQASLFAQGVNHYFTTIGNRDELQSSNGLQIDLR